VRVREPIRYLVAHRGATGDGGGHAAGLDF